jgi:hypothetical protein
MLGQADVGRLGIEHLVFERGGPFRAVQLDDGARSLQIGIKHDQSIAFMFIKVSGQRGAVDEERNSVMIDYVLLVAGNFIYLFCSRFSLAVAPVCKPRQKKSTVLSAQTSGMSPLNKMRTSKRKK